MFDKINKYFVESVQFSEDSSPRKSMKDLIISNFLSILALCISTLSPLVSYWSFSSNQEGLNVIVSRDRNSAIEVVGPVPIVEMYPDFERTDSTILVKWNAAIVNTSLSATIPITSIRIANVNFMGKSSIFDMDKLVSSSPISVQSIDGNEISLPIGIKPGEIIKLNLYTKLTVSILAYPSSEKIVGIPVPSKGTYYSLMGKDGMDPFGNKGEEIFEEFHFEEKAKVRQPCIKILIKTGRNNIFFGTGY